jgi:hypothetical protein
MSRNHETLYRDQRNDILVLLQVWHDAVPPWESLLPW